MVPLRGVRFSDTRSLEVHDSHRALLRVFRNLGIVGRGGSLNGTLTRRKVSLRPLRSHPRSWLQRSLTSTMYRMGAAIVEEFSFADRECNRWLV